MAGSQETRAIGIKHVALEVGDIDEALYLLCETSLDETDKTAESIAELAENRMSPGR